MNLTHGQIRPGIVKSIDNNGIIRAISPGLFVIESDNDVDKLPPIMPGFFGGSNTSLPSLGDEIWILRFTDNPLELFWFKKSQSSLNNEGINNIGTGNSEIICNKQTESGNASLYFSDESGWVINNSDSSISIESDGSILLNSDVNGRAIHINGNNISIGSKDSSAHPAAFGDTLEEILLLMCEMMNKIAMKALMNPYTAAIGTEILSVLPSINEKISSVASENVTID